jgi:flagellar motor switch protein FliN/FliY
VERGPRRGGRDPFGKIPFEGWIPVSDSEQVNQDEIEKLLRQSQQASESLAASPATAPVSGGAAAAVAPSSAESELVDQSDIDSLLNQAQAALSSLEERPAELPAGVQPFEFKDLAASAASNEPATLDLVRDVQLDLKIELGRTHMYLEDVLRLKQGAVVTLDKLAGDPVDIYANGRLIARGEVLVLNDSFCVRVAELVTGDSNAA